MGLAHPTRILFFIYKHALRACPIFLLDINYRDKGGKELQNQIVKFLQNIATFTCGWDIFHSISPIHYSPLKEAHCPNLYVYGYINRFQKSI